MPLSVLVTVPAPVPDLVTVREKVVTGWRLKVAVQVLLASMVTEPVLEQPVPLQPEKMDPVAGVALSVTEVPLL